MNKEGIEDKADEYVNFEGNSVFFKNVFKTLSVLNNSAKIYFDKEEIRTSIFDPAHVMMINLTIPKIVLGEYHVKQDTVLGIDLDKMNYILKSSGKNDTFKFLYDIDKNIDKAFIGIGIFNHEHALINKDGLPDSKIPNLELPVIVKLDTKLLYDFLVQADKISDYIEMVATKDNFTLNAIGDSDKVTITLKGQLMNSYVCDKTYKSLYSIDYLLSIIKQLKVLFKDITLNMANDNPLRIICDNGYKVEVLLAPRIESD